MRPGGTRIGSHGGGLYALLDGSGGAPTETLTLGTAAARSIAPAPSPDPWRKLLPRRLLDRVFGRHGLGHNTGVRAAVALVLGQNFRKSKKTSTSNWALHQLSPGQIRYAANDAHAPAVLHRALPAWEAAQAAAAAARPPRATRPHISRIST